MSSRTDADLARMGPEQRDTRKLYHVVSRTRSGDRVAKEHPLSADEAVERVAQDDANRRGFLVHHVGRDPDDPTHYDIMMNLGTLSMDAAWRSSSTQYSRVFRDHPSDPNVGLADAAVQGCGPKRCLRRSTDGQSVQVGPSASTSARSDRSSLESRATRSGSRLARFDFSQGSVRTS